MELLRREDDLLRAIAKLGKLGHLVKKYIGD